MAGMEESGVGIEARIRQVERQLPPVPRPGGGQLSGMGLDALMTRLDVPGVGVAVVNDGRLEWARGYGVRDADSGEPVELDTRFQAASISKPISALAALRLVEDGRLDLDADVNTYLTSWHVPATGGWQPRITLRQILSHSAGLTVHGFPGYRRDRPLPTLTQVLDGEPPANTPPVRVDTLPGAQFRYSGGGYTVLQQLLVDVSGSPFPDLLRSLVLEPAGMAHSSYGQPLSDVVDGGVASGHRTGGGVVHGRWHVYPELAAAALWTTPSDLCRLAILLQQTLAGRVSAILAPAMLRRMLEPPADPHMGLGFFLAGAGAAARFGHTGGNEGFRCELVVYREGGCGAAIMTNSDDGTIVSEAVLRAVATAYGWPGYLPDERTAGAVEPGTLERYTGTFELRPGYRLAVGRDGRGLTLAAPGQPPLALDAAPDGRWIARALEARVRFDDGDNAGLVVEQNGREMHGTRVS